MPKDWPKFVKVQIDKKQGRKMDRIKRHEKRTNPQIIQVALDYYYSRIYEGSRKK